MMTINQNKSYRIIVSNLMIVLLFLLFACRNQELKNDVHNTLESNSQLDSVQNYIDQGNYQKAQILLEKISFINDSVEEPMYQQRLRLSMLNAHLNKNIDNWEMSIQYYMHAQEIVEKYGTQYEKAGFYIQLAEFHRVILEKERAHEYLEQAKGLLKDNLQDFKLLSRLYNRFAAISIDPDTIEHYSLLAYEYAIKAKDKRLMATSLNELGMLYRYKGREVSMGLYFDALGLWREINSRHDELNTLVNIVRLAYNLSDFDYALNYLDTLELRLENRDLWYIVKSMYELKTLSYRGLNMYDSAFHYQKLFYEYSEKKLREQKRLKVEQLEIANSINKKNRIIKKQLNDIKQTNKTILFLGAIIGLILILFIIFIVINRIFKKKNIKIIIQHEEIQFLYTELEEHLKHKESLFKELHYRVTGNLAHIKNICEYQKINTEKSEVKQLLDDTIARLESINKVHQLVYSDRNLSKINTCNYINLLCGFVSQLQNNDQKQISYKINCHNKINLEQKFVYLIGMIVNELILNSIKHASPPENKLLFTISLTEDDKCFNLHYKDNGQVLTEISNAESDEKTGFYLIKTLTQQLKGKYHIDKSKAYEVSFYFRKKMQ